MIERSDQRTHASEEPSTSVVADIGGGVDSGTDLPTPTAQPGIVAGRRSRAATGLASLGSGLAVRYGLLGLWLAMIVVYTIAMPNTFFQVAVLQTVLSSQSAILLLAVSALCTLSVGEFDLSFAAVMGLSATVVPVLAGLHGVNILLACAVALVVSVVCGILNAVLVVVAGVPSLVVTLGTASLFLGISQLLSSSTTLSITDETLTSLTSKSVLGLPLSFYYGVGIILVFAYLLAWTPTGRHMIFVGANREVAKLAGIRVNRIRAMSYVVGSGLAGFAGLVLVGTVGGFDPTASQSYLLPALAAVFLGTTVVQPGQFNPIGVAIGIYFLATGIIGLQLLGYSNWVQDAFYGGGLVFAVTLATIVRARVRAN